jgi:hypothetical protein
MIEYWLEMPAAEEAATDRQQLTVARHGSRASQRENRPNGWR